MSLDWKPLPLNTRTQADMARSSPLQSHARHWQLWVEGLFHKIDQRYSATHGRVEVGRVLCLLEPGNINFVKCIYSWLLIWLRPWLDKFWKRFQSWRFTDITKYLIILAKTSIFSSYITISDIVSNIVYIMYKHILSSVTAQVTLTHATHKFRIKEIKL